ncbi:MAG: ribose 5-phosphate isomerase B [Actinomycetota bacterium]
MSSRALPPEEEIRALVRKVVASVVGGAGSPPVSDAPHPANAPDPAPSTAGSKGRIAIGSDHGGFRLKERLGFRLQEQGWQVVDCGTDSTEAADYPVFAHEVAARVASGEAEVGIIVDGAGIGSSMVANKVPGVRAALCYDLSSAANSREHNHANVLTLGAGLVGESLAWQIVQTWLATPWSEGRHADRVAMIDEVDRRYRGGPGRGKA